MVSRRRAGPWLFTVLAYTPVLLTAPGKVAADTKTYLYLDINRFLAGASSMWDPKIGMGTVSHQTIGYLFPMGPFYWVAEELFRLPAWVAQRLWLGTLVLAAGFGVRYLLRVLGIGGPGVGVAMLAYAFSPYVIEFSPRLSVLLGPWAALPWLIGFVVLATQRGGWRYPALFAITVQIVGGVNASSLLFALIGPVLWLPYAVVVLRDSTWKRVWSVAWRTAFLTVVTSLWWVSGLLVQGRYGLDVLRFSESLRSVSFTGLPSEVLRGLGYWFFYGTDQRGVWWNDGVHDLVGKVLLLGLSFAIPVIAMIAAALLRWRDRAYFVILTLVGFVIAVGASPYEHPSILGGWFKSFASSSTAGFALRSTARAVPLVVLGLAVLLGAGVTSAVNFLRAHDRPQLATVAIAVIGALCIVNAPQIWHGRYYTKDLERSEQVPSYYRKALAALDAKSHSTRVLALPGADFAAYRWGNTVDPIEPGLMDRPYVARELVPWGSEPAANLLQALDHRLQEGNFEQESLAPIARLMGVGDILLRMDLATNRFALVPPAALWSQFVPDAPDGTSTPRAYGHAAPNGPPPVATVSVHDPLPIVRAKPTEAPIVVDGDGEGLVDAAASGLVDARHAVIYSASYEQQPKKLEAMVSPQTWVVVTDSNRRRAERWSGMINNFGYTEQAGERPMRVDPVDQRLDVFPGSDDNARTVTVFRGIRSVQATAYGSPGFGYTLGARPARALDGDVTTGWEVGENLGDVSDQRLRIVLDHPITTDRVNLVQAFALRPRLRWIHAITLRFDGKAAVRRTLDPTSRVGAGQDVTFGRRTFQSLEITIDDVRPRHALPGTRTPVGFAEVRLRDGSRGAPVRAQEVLRMPRDLLSNRSIPWATTPLALVMTRNDDAIWDEFSLPVSRDFTLSGGAKLYQAASDAAIDHFLGLPDASEGGVTVTSSGRVINSFAARGSEALDGKASTAWVPALAQPRPWIRIEVAKPRTFDHLDLRVRNGGTNSVPTRISIRSDDGTVRDVPVPVIADTTSASSSALVHLSFTPITGRRFTFTITDTRVVRSTLSRGATIVDPIGIAELGIPGVRRADVPERLPDRCVGGLAQVDGQDVPVKLIGTTDALLGGRGVALGGCGSRSNVALDPGAHDVRGAVPRRSGLTVQRIVLRSAIGRSGVGRSSSSAAVTAPKVRVVKQSRWAMTVRVEGAARPFWMILGESHSRGWAAKAGGKGLGPSQLVDGYANGWLVTPQAGRSSFDVTLEFTPQRMVNEATIASAFAVLACLLVIAYSYRRRAANPALVVNPGFEHPPVLGDPRLAFGATPAFAVSAVTAVVTGSVAAVVTRPFVGVVAAVLAFYALRRGEGRFVLAVAAPVLLFGVACYVTFEQLRHHYPLGLGWPTFFEDARIAGSAAIVLLATDAVVEIVRRRSASNRDEP